MGSREGLRGEEADCLGHYRLEEAAIMGIIVSMGRERLTKVEEGCDSSNGGLR